MAPYFVVLPRLSTGKPRMLPADSCPVYASAPRRGQGACHRKESRMGRSSTYPAEFRREAVRLVLHTHRTTAHVAKDTGISYTTLGNWVRTERRGTARRRGRREDG